MHVYTRISQLLRNDQWPSGSCIHTFSSVYWLRCAEGSGTPLQYFCLENPIGQRSLVAWWHMEAFLFSNLEALQTFWIFMEASLQRHYWSNHQPLVVDSISSSLPQPEIREWDWKFHLFFHGWFPWRPAPIPRYFPKSPHEYKPRCAGMGFIMNTETPISPFWLWSNVRIWGQRTILLTKDIPIACMAQEIPRVWGAMSQEP